MRGRQRGRQPARPPELQLQRRYAEDWTFTPQPTKDGAFLIQTAATGRCLHVKGGSSAVSAGMESYDCNATSVYQRFIVQAVETTN